MAIIDLVQRTTEWFAWRKEGITASMIPVIMGLSPYQTPYGLRCFSRQLSLIS
jgi:predicted phage-related endonuclease